MCPSETGVPQRSSPRELRRGWVGEGALRVAEPGPARWHHGDGRLGGKCAVLGWAAGHPHGRLPGTLTAAMSRVTPQACPSLPFSAACPARAAGAPENEQTCAHRCSSRTQSTLAGERWSWHCRCMRPTSWLWLPRQLEMQCLPRASIRSWRCTSASRATKVSSPASSTVRPIDWSLHGRASTFIHWRESTSACARFLQDLLPPLPDDREITPTSPICSPSMMAKSCYTASDVLGPQRIIGCSCCAGKPERWVHSQSKRPHTHDVRTLCVVNLPDEDPALVSGGNDAQLLVHSMPRYTQVRAYCERQAYLPYSAVLLCT